MCDSYPPFAFPDHSFMFNLYLIFDDNPLFIQYTILLLLFPRWNPLVSTVEIPT